MSLLGLLWFKAPLVYAYMLQQFEYNPEKFIAWAIKLPDLFKVQKRGKLHLTKRAKLMVFISYSAWIAIIFAAIILATMSHNPLFALLLLLAPVSSVMTLTISSFMLQTFVVNPKQKREVATAKSKLSNMDAIRIAVLGSYGKTTMKELLATVISQAKKVASTPGNKNVLISHARWINNKLEGNEEVLIFEYGEAAPGDISKLAAFSKPTIAVVTGLAPAHLDAYPSVDAIADDFADINKAVAPDKVYVNGDSSILKAKVLGNYYTYKGLGEWKVTDVKVDFSGTEFSLSNGKQTFKLKTGLLGVHQIGPLAAVVAIAQKLGLSDDEIVIGVAATKPYEHRMQPRSLGGAWIIDDTYNGNIEGMRAGLALLKILPGKNKIYVTPGLVDQGAETVAVHHELGQLIATAEPDRVILMQNSTTNYIKAGLNAAAYKGEIVVQTHPLEYYTNLEHFLAAGDVVLLQNDWPDSYT